MRSHIGTFEERLIEGEWIGDGTSVRNATVQYLNQESTYIGDLKNMTRHGKGRVVHHSYGSIIDTNFVEGVMSGPFNAIMNDGKAEGVTDGETLFGKRYIRADSIVTPEEIASLGNPEWAIVREGVFDLPTLTLNGHGKVTYPNGDYYIGELKKDIQEGFGTVYSKTSGKLSGYIQGPRFVGKVRWEMTDGNVYEGELLDNKPHGQGTLTSPDGLVTHGTWVDDQLVQTIGQIMYMADDIRDVSKSAAGMTDLRLKSGSEEVQGGGARTFKPPASNNIAKMQGFDLYKSPIYTGRHAISIAAAMPRSCLPKLSTRRPTFAGLMIGMIRMCRK